MAAAAVSLVASIVALVGAADAVGKTLSKARLLYRAPDELLALNSEISDLKVVMRNIGSHLHATDPTSSQESLNHLKILVERARDRTLQLDQLIHYQFLKSGSFDGDYKIFRLRWARSKNAVESYRQALCDAKQNIVIHMLAIDAYEAKFYYLDWPDLLSIDSLYQPRIYLLIDEIFTTSN